MKIFTIFEGVRKEFDVCSDEKIEFFKERVVGSYGIDLEFYDDSKQKDTFEDKYTRQKAKILSLKYAGAELNDNWTFSDIGIATIVTLKAYIQNELRPLANICSYFNRQTIPINEEGNVHRMLVATLRSLVSSKIGLPIGVFRLTNKDGLEMFDEHTLETYKIVLGGYVNLHTWDGWNDFLNAAIKGITQDVLMNISSKDVVAYYQMKVALYIASHFGHVDLAASLLKQGIRADEPVGDHPSRLWCWNKNNYHEDHYKTSVHVAAEKGQLSVIRTLVHYDICYVAVKDANDRTPLSVALRYKQKPCASFLLTKQWNKITYSSNFSINLSIYCKMKKWSNIAKNNVFIIYGQWKSSLKNHRWINQSGALVGCGVIINGYDNRNMSTQEMATNKLQNFSRNRSHRLITNKRMNEEDIENYFASRMLELSPGKGNNSILKKRHSLKHLIKNDSDKKSSAAKEIEISESNFPVVDNHVKTIKKTKAVKSDNIIGSTERQFQLSNSDFVNETLNHYTKYRGMNSEHYARKCLKIASNFTEKTWLRQVQQALVISQQGVKNLMNNKAHYLFKPEENVLVLIDDSNIINED